MVVGERCESQLDDFKVGLIPKTKRAVYSSKTNRTS